MGTIFIMGTGETTMTPAMRGETIPIFPSIPEGENGLSRIFTDEVLAWEAEIKRWAAEWDVDANLAATVMQIESCGYERALSKAGALGLFQVMPYHFEAGESGFHAETNARRGLAYLRKAQEAFNGDVRLALAGYNGGITGAGRAESEWNDEMRRYVYWGENIYADASSGAAQSGYVEEWLQAGGAHLCDQARNEQASSSSTGG